MFNLDKTLAAWRRRLAHNRAFTAEDIDELAQHLRDQVYDLSEEGLSEEEAFRKALREMGDYTSAETEYRKVYLGKLKQKRHLSSELSWRFSMLKNYLTITFRTMIRRKGFSLIHVFGLSIGLASCMLIGLYIQDELQYDDFHENADHVYRVLRQFDLPDLQATIETTPPALAATIKEQLPDVERAVRVGRSSPVVKRGTQEFVETRFLDAESGFFEMFSFPLQHGQADLNRPSTLVLSEQMATKYFSDDNPVGQILEIGGEAYEVTGVMANVPAQSHLQFDFVRSLHFSPDQLNWGFNNHFTYIQLKTGADQANVTRQIAAITKMNQPEREGSWSDFVPHLQPVTGIHLGLGVGVDISSEGRIMFVYLFGILAVFILLLACINFMNLATARSMDRAREVGMRKALGAQRFQLIGQFLSESILISVIGLVIALLLCWLMIPTLNEFAGKSIAYSTLFNTSPVLFFLGLALCTGLLAGSYPALVLSHFKPARTLKGEISGIRRAQLRKGLVVFQFALSIVLIVGTSIVSKQLNYLQRAGLGFTPDNLLIVDQVGYLGDKVQVFEEEASRIVGVEHAASGFSMPGTFYINSMWQSDEPGSEAHNLDYSFVNFDYIETLGIDMLAGRSISRAYATDSFAVMINEAAARDFGWSTEEALEKKIARGSRKYSVVGVVKDFNFRSLRADVYPLALFGPLRAPRYTAIRMNTEDTARTIASLETVWKQFSDLPFTYSLLADNLAAQYLSEQRLSRIFFIFTTLALLIACLGLLGLATYTAEKRTKEIGIRKTLGASTGNLFALLSKDFLKLVMIAFLIAAPMGFLAMTRWLEEYAYRVDIDPGIFLLAGGLAFLAALGTVSFQSIKAAVTNPISSLRSE